MQKSRIIFLISLGVLLGMVGIITLQYMLVMTVLVFVVIILLLGDFKLWVESLVEKIIASRNETIVTNESAASLRDDIDRIKKRLDALEKGEHE